MAWRDLFSFDTWFASTAAAHGMRDARHDYPREDTFIEVRTLVQPTANSTRFEPWQAPSRDGGTGPLPEDTLKLAPFEFEELKIAETRIDTICQGVERARQSFESQMSQVHHQMQDLHREALRVRAAHGEKNFAEPHPLMAKWLYVLIMVVMGCAELVFNATAFRLIEAGQDYQSYIMALAPTLCY